MQVVCPVGRSRRMFFLQRFIRGGKGFLHSTEGMVEQITLIIGYTLGITHCSFIQRIPHGKP